MATGLGIGIGLLGGWPVSSAVVLGLAISVASTVVLLRALERQAEIETQPGRVAVGWLIVEDLFTVLVLVVIPSVAPGRAEDSLAIAGDVALALVKIAVLTAVMLFIGARLLPRLRVRVDRDGSRELFTLAVLAIALGIAFAASEIFDVSFALGAFLAGAVLSGSRAGDRAAENALPMTDAFGVLFFVAVGMLLDPAVVAAAPPLIAAVVGVVVVGKFATAVVLVTLFRGSRITGLVVGAGLAQIGEFSFIVATTAVAAGLLTQERSQVIVAASLASIALNPLAFAFAERMSERTGRV